MAIWRLQANWKSFINHVFKRNCALYTVCLLKISSFLLVKTSPIYLWGFCGNGVAKLVAHLLNGRFLIASPEQTFNFCISPPTVAVHLHLYEMAVAQVVEQVIRKSQGRWFNLQPLHLGKTLDTKTPNWCTSVCTSEWIRSPVWWQS